MLFASATTLLEKKKIPTYATLASRFSAKPPVNSYGAGSGGWRFQPSAPDDHMELVFGNATSFPRTQEQVGTFPGQCSNPLNLENRHNILRGTGMALPSVNPNPPIRWISSGRNRRTGTGTRYLHLRGACETRYRSLHRSSRPYLLCTLSGQCVKKVQSTS